MRLLAPSILSADFLNLGNDVDFVNNNADIFHFDVMDGSFVKNLSFGFPIIDAIRPVAEKPIDVHLMIVNPDKYIERFIDAGAAMVSFHKEAADLAGLDISSTLRTIRSKGAKAGLVINPDIDVKELFPYIKEADFFLLMSVFAGFGGQKFIESTYGRIKELKAEILRQGAECLIEVDGGVSAENADLLVECGADILVAGSSVFKADDREKAAKEIRFGK